jgi:hypothetical protein
MYSFILFYFLKRFIVQKIQRDTQGYKFVPLTNLPGHAVAQLVEALRYKPEDRGFNSRWFH